MATTAIPTPEAPAPAPALTPTQELVIALIADGMYISTVATEAGIHRNTIHNWRRTNPIFAAALAAAQYDRVLFWREEAEKHAHLAIHTIASLLHDSRTPAGVRLRAALAMLQHATTLPPAEPPAPPTVVQPAPSTKKVHNSAQPPTPIDSPRKPGRNTPCPCGSGKKQKLCCLNR